MLPSYWKQSTDLHYKLADLCLYKSNTVLEKINHVHFFIRSKFTLNIFLFQRFTDMLIVWRWVQKTGSFFQLKGNFFFKY